MPLIKCPDCGALISDSANICNKCSYPLSENILNCPECNAKAFKSQESCINCGFPFSRIDKVENKPNSHNIEIKKDPDVVDEVRSAIALSKNYVSNAFIVLILYFVFYLPGLIFNIVWLREIKSVKMQSGTYPSGTGCLTVLYIFFFVIPLLSILIMIFMSAFGIGFLSSFF